MMKKETENLIDADYIRYYGVTPSRFKFIRYFFSALKNPSFGYMFWFRLSKKTNLARLVHRFLSIKYGIQIPLGTEIGGGFYIGHAVGIIVNKTAKIGRNVNIS